MTGKDDALDAYLEGLGPRIIKSELAKRGIDYKELASKFQEQGLQIQDTAIASRMYRGKKGEFSLSFFIACMVVSGAVNEKGELTIVLPDYYKLKGSQGGTQRSE